jgi:hypothetical protein
MSELEFAGPATPLTDADIGAAAERWGIEAALLAAVAEVESAGAGFLSDGRPRILYERHVFHRLTQGRYSAAYPGISNPVPRGYGPAGAHQYVRLDEAIELDRRAALQSASWGRFQIMGFNYAATGFDEVESFVSAMCESEARHLEAFVAFVRANDLLRYLIAHDWRRFTMGYNGTGNVDEYSRKLAEAYRRHAAATAGDPIVAQQQAVQSALAAAGYDPGPIDGWPGARTLAAMSAYRRARGV